MRKERAKRPKKQKTSVGGPKKCLRQKLEFLQ